ncbi:tetratricopeptide repeat protein 9C [Lissotriton helveticus]
MDVESSSGLDDVGSVSGQIGASSSSGIMDAGPSSTHMEAASSSGQVHADLSFAQMDDRLQQAQIFKDAGNKSYKEQRYRDAISKYHRALLQLKGLDPNMPSPLQAFGAKAPVVTPEQEKALHNLQRDCYNNLAACLLHTDPVPYARVLQYSVLVLEKQPSNAKALYRAGVASFHLRDFDSALHYLGEAQRIQPTDANVKKYLKLTDSELSGYRQQEKQLYRDMFK